MPFHFYDVYRRTSFARPDDNESIFGALDNYQNVGMSWHEPVMVTRESNSFLRWSGPVRRVTI